MVKQAKQPNHNISIIRYFKDFGKSHKRCAYVLSGISVFTRYGMFGRHFAFHRDRLGIRRCRLLSEL